MYIIVDDYGSYDVRILWENFLNFVAGGESLFNCCGRLKKTGFHHWPTNEWRQNYFKMATF
jgi:hypothetical protein